MFTGERSEVAMAIKNYRSIRSLSQDKLAQELGLSGCFVSSLERLQENRVTPAVYAAFQSIGFDLKTPVPSIIIEKMAGKTRRFQTKITDKVTRKDPIKLLHEAKSLVSEANMIINTKIDAWTTDVTQKRVEIDELEALKLDLQTQREKILSEIISV